MRQCLGPNKSSETSCYADCICG